jgi:outer membrane receptor protein involved in Fe transport
MGDFARGQGRIRILALAGAASLVLASAPALAQQQTYNIPATSLSEALRDFGQASGKQIIFTEDLVRGKKAPALKGSFTSAEALSKLLAGSGLRAKVAPSGAIMIVSAEGNAGAAEAAAPMGDISADAGQAASASDGGDRADEAIVVTGTNIRRENRASPVTVVTRRDIERTGSQTVQGVLATLPQNAGGGSLETLIAGNPNDNASQANVGLGSGVNLRGLGSGSTLVLVDGRRIAPASGIADFVDVSLFPLPIIERIEVLADGASSIYGGDAVAGVVNLILRKDYDGAELGGSYGQEAESGMAERRLYATFGRRWNGGGALVSGEIYNRDNLSAGDKSFTKEVPVPNDLMPSQKRRSLFAEGHQDLSDSVRLNLQALASSRTADLANTLFSVGNIVLKHSTTSLYDANASLVADLSPEWSLNLGATGSQATTRSKTISGSAMSDRRWRSGELDADARLNGNFHAGALGRVDVALGTQIRKEDFRTTNLITDASNLDTGRIVKSVFGETQIEPISPASGGPIERASLNLSGRYERYSDFGGQFTYKLGAVIEPWKGGRLRGTFGTAFNPPDLGRVGAADTVLNVLSNTLVNSIFNFPVEIDDPRPYGFLSGTAKDLGPETSKTWTAGVDQEVERGGFKGRISATYYDVDYRQRIDVPTFPIDPLNAINAFLSGDPALPPNTVIANASPELVAELAALARAEGGFVDFFHLVTSEADIYYIVDGRVKNMARTRTNGIDMSATANFPLGGANATLGLSFNKILGFADKDSPAAPAIKAIDRYLHPADLRGRIIAGIDKDGFGAFLAGNYTDSYLDDTQAVPRRVPAYITVDGGLSFTFTRSGALHGLRAALTATNIFDRDPPRFEGVPNYGILNYDPVNASPLGRMVTISVSKAF